jgi:peptide/nickel transport system permease protein
MGGYLIRRLLSVLPTLLGITLVTFLLLEALPGREMALLGGEGRALPSPSALQQIRRTYHLDEPVGARYLAWLLRVARWDLGESLLDGRSVGSVIGEASLPTLALNVAALLFAFGVAIPMGVAWARRRGSRGERAGTLVLLVLYAFPNFAAALLLQQLLAVRFHLLPLQGIGDPLSGASLPARAGDFLLHLALPALCLGYGSLAYLARFTRANLLEAIGREYLLAARARGVAESVLAWKHAFRNAAIPLLTLVGLLVPALLGGSVLIETIFSWPGLGRLYFYSLSNRDYPVVLGLTTLTAFLTLAGSLLADFLYGLADPRVAAREGR